MKYIGTAPTKTELPSGWQFGFTGSALIQKELKSWNSSTYHQEQQVNNVQGLNTQAPADVPDAHSSHIRITNIFSDRTRNMGGTTFSDNWRQWNSGFNHGVIIPCWEPGPRGMLDVSGVIVEWSRWRNKCVSMNGVCINTPHMPPDESISYMHQTSIDGFNANKCQFKEIIIDKEKSFFHKLCGRNTTGQNLILSGTVGTCSYTGYKVSGSATAWNQQDGPQYQHGDLFGASHGTTNGRWSNGTVRYKNSSNQEL